MFECVECHIKKLNGEKSYTWGSSLDKSVCRSCVQTSKYHGYLNHHCGMFCQIPKQKSETGKTI